MVYSPSIVLIRDDHGEWRSPVEVDVLTSAAVNAGEIRRELEREERSRLERVEMENWRKRGEERRKENERAMVERQRPWENKKAEEEIAKEQANLVKLQKEMAIGKGTDKGKAKYSGSEKEEPFDEQEKAVAEVENENEENKKESEAEVEKPEENQENTIDRPDYGLGNDSDSQLKGAEENTESKGTLIQDDQHQAEAPPEVNQEFTSSSTIVHLPSTRTQPSDSLLKGVKENTESKGTLIQDDQHQPEAPPEVNQEPTSSSTIVHPLSPPIQPSDSQLKSAEENTESKGTPIQDDQYQPEAPPEVNQEPTSSSAIVYPISPPTQPSDSLKSVEENTESKGTPIQDDQHNPDALLEVNQEPTSSTIVHPLSPPTQPSQTPDPDPNLIYALALENAEIRIEQTMRDRISRILHLFQLHQARHLILGSFGTGVFKNRIDLVATIFADLLINPGGRFRDVFQTVVFAILGKETVRVFSEVFSRADKRAQREITGKTRVFVDSFGNGSDSDGDVKEGDEEKTLRELRWKARRSELNRRDSFMYDIPEAAADSTSSHPAQIDAAFHPLSSNTALASAVSYPASSAAADAAYAPFFDAAQADAAGYVAQANEAANVANAAFYNAVQASTASYAPSFDAAQADAAFAASSNAAQAWAAASAAFFNAAQACSTASAAFSNAAQASTAAYAASAKAFQSSAAVSATSSNTAQTSAAYPPSIDATNASAIPHPTSFTATHRQADAAVQPNPTAVDYYGIPEDIKMILTRDDEKVDFVAEATADAPITPEAIVVDDGKDIEMTEVKNLPTCSCEAQSSKSNKKEDGDDEPASS